jgi:hypothetical protein
MKKGDKVRCIDNTGSGLLPLLQVNKIYTISGFYNGSRRSCLTLEEVPGKIWNLERFIIIKLKFKNIEIL